MSCNVTPTTTTNKRLSNQRCC